MTVYYGVIAGLAVFWALLRIGGRSVLKDRIFLLTAFAALAFLSASRYGVGIDYSMVYAPQYEGVLADPSGYSVTGNRMEPGFVVLEKLTAFFSPNYQALFVVTSVLMMALFALSYWKLSPNPFVSVFLFLTLSQYYCSMNFIRQTMAGAIALLALPFLMKRKFHFYLPIVLAASLFHKSTLILIPFYFINLLPLTNLWVLGGTCAVTAGIYFNTHRIMAFVTRFWYQSYHLESEHVLDTFSPPFALAAAGVFLVLLLGSKWLLKKNTSNYVYVNYAYYAFFFTLMGTRHAILDRLSLYFTLAAPIALAILLDALWKGEDGAPALRRTGGTLQAQRRRLAGYLAACLAVFGGSLAIHRYALDKDHHGVVPYHLIFDQPFYAEYKEWLAWDQQVDAASAFDGPETEPPV